MFKKTLLSAAALLAAGTLSASVFAAPVTAEGTGVGKHGDITVAVTFDAGKIQDIKIVKNAENPILAKKVFTDLKDQVVALSSTDVDLVSGATFSAKGFIDAVNDAAKKAGVTLAKADKKALKKAARELPKTSNYDVVVIGAGGAGFSAAITARNAGANVVLLEKMPAVGGNSLISGAEMNAAKNWVQPKLGINDDSPELHAQDTFKGGDGKGDMKVINVMTHQALDAAKWCRDYLGVRFEDDNLFFFGGHSRKRALIPVGHTGTEFIAKFQAKADELGIPVITNMKAEELIKNKDGRVVGVKATMDGSEYTFNAKGGVVLATGGFGANAELVGRFAPRLGHLRSTNLPGTTGDLIAPLEDIGAAAVGMDFFQLLPGSAEDGRFIGAASPVERMIFVNRAGERFIAEDSPSSKLSAAVLAQPGGIAFPILDANGYSAMRTLSRAMFDRALMRGDAFEANSIPELASLLQIPAEALVATVDAHNEAVETGHDPVGRRAAVLMHRIARRPFYGAKVTMCVNGTLGGIAITPRAEVLDRHGRVIPRLYAAGEVTGGVHGANYMGGNALSEVFTFGRIAGENAVQEPFA